MAINGKVRVFVLSVMLFITTGCYGCFVGVPISSNQRGLHLPDGTNPEKVLAPGRHSDGAYYSDLQIIDVGVKTFDWSDSSLVTSDKQPIGLSLSISVERPKEEQPLIKMYSDYRGAAIDDAALQTIVTSRIPRVAKGVSSELSLDELLGRNEAQVLLFEQLQQELSEFGVTLIDVGISDIQVSPDYTASLEQKAKSQIQSDIAKQEALRYEQELIKEQKISEIELEKAIRENSVKIEQSKALEASPVLLQLELARIMADTLGDKDKVFFVPQNAGLNFFLSPNMGGEQVKETIIQQTTPVTDTAGTQ